MATKTKKAAASLAGAVNKKNAAKPAAGKAKPSSGGGGKGGWSAVGWEVADEQVKQHDQQAELRKNDVYRFWLKEGASTKITFVDSVPLNMREHDFEINGKWGNQKTCLQGTGEPCPYCEADNRAYFVAMFTVIDHTKFTGRDNKERQYQIRLFPAKAETLKILKVRVAKNGQLGGMTVDVSRTGEKSARVGTMFDFDRRVNLNDPKVYKAMGFKEAPKPIDYKKKLAPLTREQAKSWMNGGGNSGGFGTSEGSNEEVTY